MSPSTTIIDAMKVMNLTGMKIVLVAEENGKFLGVATDGNVRKGLTRHTSIDLTALDVMNKDAVTIESTAPTHSIKKRFNDPNILALPVLNKAGHLCGCYFADSFLSKSYETARLLIMAGGLGKRMGKLTRHTPKPMLEIDNKPMLQHIIDNALAHDLRDITISTHFEQEKIIDYFGNGSNFDANIEYISEQQPLGTAGCIKNLKFGDNYLVVINGDIISKIDYSSLLDYHVMMNSMATMATHEHEIINPYGVVETNGINITDVKEKPKWITNVNAGVYVFNPAVQNLLSATEKIDMPDFFRRILYKNFRAIMYPLAEKPIEIGTLKQYSEVVSEKQ